MARRVTAKDFLNRKAEGVPIVLLTAYDYPTARLVEAAGVDGILVGDSLANVVQGRETTLPVTLDEMVYHTSLVARAARRALVVADMPFLSYQVGVAEAVANAGRLLKEGGAGAVKLEGGRESAAVVGRLVEVGIPVMGHLGLTPQSVHALGGYTVQGRTEEAARRLLEDALLLEEVGVFAVVLELVPREVAAAIARRLRVPVIGIGSGAEVDGQVLVLHDLVGLGEGETPRHARRYADVGGSIREAAQTWAADVRARRFPGDAHAPSLGEGAPAVLAALDAVARRRDP